jgi:hypothetical protein
MLGLSAFLILMLMLTKGGSLLFLLKVVAVLDLIVFSIFLLVVVLLARGLSFVLTNRNVLVRTNGQQLGVPLEEIKSVEVRSYGTEYGSVYLERCSDPLETVAGKSIELGKQSGSIWLAVPRSQPQLFGFLGFKNFDDFGRMIVDLHNASRARPMESEGGIGVEPKYRLPTWIQFIWVVVLTPILVLEVVPSISRLVLGPIAIVALAMLAILTGLYNKTKTGMWLPGSKKVTPESDKTAN